MRRTQWRRVRLLMGSRLSRASTNPGNINEHASNTSRTSITVTSALHAAHPKQATITVGGQTLGSPAIAAQTDRTRTRRGPWTKSRRLRPGHYNTPAQTSDYWYTEAEEGREGPDKYIYTGQILGLLVGLCLLIVGRCIAAIMRLGQTMT